MGTHPFMQLCNAAIGRGLCGKVDCKGKVRPRRFWRGNTAYLKNIRYALRRLHSFLVSCPGAGHAQVRRRSALKRGEEDSFVPNRARARGVAEKSRPLLARGASDAGRGPRTARGKIRRVCFCLPCFFWKTGTTCVQARGVTLEVVAES